MQTFFLKTAPKETEQLTSFPTCITYSIPCAEVTLQNILVEQIFSLKLKKKKKK